MPTDNIIQLHALSKKDAERYIKDIACDSSRVFFSKHAKTRMIERHITRKEVIACLDRFSFYEDPHWEASHHGGYKMTIESRAIDQPIRIVMNLNNDTDADNDKDNYILIITVIDI